MMLHVFQVMAMMIRCLADNSNGALFDDQLMPIIISRLPYQGLMLSFFIIYWHRSYYVHQIMAMILYLLSRSLLVDMIVIYWQLCLVVWQTMAMMPRCVEQIMAIILS